jgi:hypothetical protein
MLSNNTVKLTRDEAERLQVELQELLDGWVERTRGREAAERRTYVLMQVLQPYPQVADEQS